jgi:hypothetical protein
MEIKKELFATHELSKLAKEKGFDDECFCFFEVENGEFYIEEFVYYEEKRKNSTVDNFYCDCTAPLYDQLTNWLRDEKDIDITIMPVFREKCGYDSFKRDGYTFEIMRIQPCQYLTWSDFNQCAEDRDEENKEHDINERCLKPSFKTHREALNEAIKQGLNLIK